MTLGVRHHVRRALGGLPKPLRPGFGILGLGLLADLAYHLALGPTTHDGPGALAIHGLVLLGMGLSLAGVVISAVGPRGRPNVPAGRRER